MGKPARIHHRGVTPASASSATVVGMSASFTVVDRGIAQLLRLVLADGWSIEHAAAELRRQVDDPRVWQRMAARVDRARADRPSAIANRAALTLSAAMRTSACAETDLS